jgi:hypothetical protein
MLKTKKTLPLQYQLKTTPDPSSTAIPKQQPQTIFSVFKHTHFNNVVSSCVVTSALNTHISTFCLKGTLISALQVILKTKNNLNSKIGQVFTLLGSAACVGRCLLTF